MTGNIFKMRTIVEKEEDESADYADISIEDVGLVDIIMRS